MRRHAGAVRRASRAAPRHARQPARRGDPAPGRRRASHLPAGGGAAPVERPRQPRPAPRHRRRHRRRAHRLPAHLAPALRHDLGLLPVRDLVQPRPDLCLLRADHALALRDLGRGGRRGGSAGGGLRWPGGVRATLPARRHRARLAAGPAGAAGGRRRDVPPPSDHVRQRLRFPDRDADAGRLLCRPRPERPGPVHPGAHAAGTCRRRTTSGCAG